MHLQQIQYKLHLYRVTMAPMHNNQCWAGGKWRSAVFALHLVELQHFMPLFFLLLPSGSDALSLSTPSPSMNIILMCACNRLPALNE